MANKTIHVMPTASTHLVSDTVRKFVDAVPANYDPSHVQAVALSSNTELAPSGAVSAGALFRISPNTPLRIARSMAGETLSARVGFYPLSSPPKNMTTPSKAAAVIRSNNIAASLDDHGEDYGPYTGGDVPWVPQFAGGGSRNFVKLVRSSANGDDYALVVSTNMSTQSSAAIKAALDANPNITVGDYVQSVECSRVYQAADLENKRLAHTAAVRMGIDSLIPVVNHPFEKTSNDKYAAPVQFARPAALARWGEIRAGHDSSVRVSNSVYDLEVCTGSAVPALRSPAHGVQMVSSPSAQKSVGAPLDPTKDKALGSVAAYAYASKASSRMGEAELEDMKRVLHWKDDNDSAVTLSVAADIARHSESLPVAHYHKMGHTDAELSNYITIGAIINV